MTQEEKQLLLQDLCARLPYGLLVDRIGKPRKVLGFSFTSEGRPLIECDNYPYCSQVYFLEDVIPYLRPMSSMTEEEKNELMCLFGGIPDKDYIYKPYTDIPYDLFGKVVDFFNAHHLDYRGLIPMGLAIEAPKDMYNN